MSLPGVAFPTDDYTPHGYLANPFAVAHSWTEGAGGCLRSSREYVGFGWQLPWALKAQASVELIVTLESGGRRLLTRADFADAGLVSNYHSANQFVYRWEAFGRVWTAQYTVMVPLQLGDHNRLGLAVTWMPVLDVPPELPDATLTIVLVGWRRDRVVSVDPDDGAIDLGAPFGRYELHVDRWGLHADDGSIEAARDFGPERTGVRLRSRIDDPGFGDVNAVALQTTPELDANGPMFEPGTRWLDPGELGDDVLAGIGHADIEDDAIWSSAARLEGDWPDHWRRGWVYDAETTRMCVFPPGGIFQDVWPSWMIQWPRAVVAEGTLDMARLAYTSPDLAKRAVLSLFRDATAPNVPCVFRDGEPNMVASDGSVCGTSPAWCIPFYNLERLYAFTLDREWLAAIYPYLARYVEWWLAERTDANGWAVYKCTWEAGEDDTPRLDPERRGDNVVSAFVRPVELQATMALSAGVLARFASVLRISEDAGRWRAVEAAYLDRTRQLWDPAEGRFRDWDARAGRFLAPSGSSEPNYWGIDPCRYSALAFTPLLAGLTDEEYRAGLRRELEQYAAPPWTLWASWSYVVLEAAPLTEDPAFDDGHGAVGFAGRVAAEIVDRVYRELDARDPAGPSHPTPGVAREFWPLDLDSWASCEGYGWGANTASLLVRQVFGFLEGPYDADAPRLTFELRPALPDDFLVPGREYWLTNLPYRGARLHVGYRVGTEPGTLALLISAGALTHCRVRTHGGDVMHISVGPCVRHEASGQNGVAYTVELDPAAVGG